MRRSSRAKYISLKYSVGEGLEVVVPERVRLTQTMIDEALNRNQAWIEKTRRKVEAVRENLPSPEDQTQAQRPPNMIELRALEKSFAVTYKNTRNPGVTLREKAKGFAVSGQTQEEELVKEVLRLHIKKYARPYFKEKLDQLSARTGLEYKSFSVRSQKTRWGSCSSRKTINMNQKLLFLPEYLVDYVIIHELCHTVHMNHSRDFWNLVEVHDPEYRQNEIELKTAGQMVPAWF